MFEKKRLENEKKFINWYELDNGGRIYYYEVDGKYGWKARYVKEVNKVETTLKFYQEIYNQYDELVEIHEKYPIDKGHKEVK